MRSNYLVSMVFLLPFLVSAEAWVDVGADAEAKYYVDIDSMRVEGENINVIKKGVYTRVMSDKFEEDKQVAFKITKARLELDCVRELNRITQIDMVDEAGEVVWSSGHMSRQMWLSIKDQGHARTTFDLICSQVR
ncbi:MAG: hypothetical protein O3B03_03510 [Proteobacteria bacterium]|nr:hypothetical protein [Pseudomonadota bacterium]MDA1332475.1 hypothetical protein [Pseudomonadota bacterium]